MSAKNILEPAAVIGLLIAGVWFNRQTGSSPLFEYEESWNDRKWFGRIIRTPNTQRFKETWPSRLLWQFPYLIEVCFWLLIYLTYQFGRGVLAARNSSNRVVEMAQRHGAQILSFESLLGVRSELTVQKWFIQHHPLALEVLNRIYSWVHITATVAFFGYLYYTVPHAQFTAVRRSLAMANLIAFLCFTAWPCAPPRLLPPEYGFVDTVHESSVRSVWNSNRFQNQYAAMPSLHFGYSFIIGTTLYLSSRRSHLGLVALLYPVVIVVAIVATANHYVLDALAGLLVACLAYYSNTLLLNLLVLEDYVFNALHLHRPNVDVGEAQPPLKQHVQLHKV